MSATAEPDISWADLRNFAQFAAEQKGEWAGAPIPVEHVPLVMEPRYPFQGLNGMKLKGDQPISDDGPDADVINSWYSYRHSGMVYIFRDGGKVCHAILPEGPGRRLHFWLNTFGVAAHQVWTAEAEARAVEKLSQLLTPHAFKCYQLTGSFLETSRRSKVTYLFRKLRPTLAIRPDDRNDTQVIAVLCMHPLGYYAESWAGVMTPTDDVIAHLVLMRGDEHRLWKKANHHTMHMASAGI